MSANDYILHKNRPPLTDNVAKQYRKIAYSSCELLVEATKGKECIGHCMTAAIFPDFRDSKSIENDPNAIDAKFDPLVSEFISEMIKNALERKRHIMHNYLTKLQIQMQCHSIKQGRLKIQYDMRGCRIPFNSIECALVHEECDYKNNHGLCKVPIPIKYNWKLERMEYDLSDNTPISTEQDVQDIEKYVPSIIIDSY